MKPEPETDSRPIITLLSGDKMYIDELDSLGLRQANGIYEPAETKFIQSFVKPDMICVDIGANIGYYTIMMARLAECVYAFEPDTLNYNMLLKNLKLNKLDGRTGNVLAIGYAVGQTDGQITLHRCSTNNGMHRIYPSKWCDADQENVRIVPLDLLINGADFIKIDIEGAEYGALLGMSRILKESHPVLMMEFHVPSIKEYGKAEPREVFDYILSMDYDISFPDRPLVWEELYELGTKWGGINIVCTKRQ